MPRVNSDGSIDSYEISNIDESGAIAYYGYIDKIGNWYIRQVTATVVRYARGSVFEDYSSCWDEDGHYAGILEFDYFHEVF